MPNEFLTRIDLISRHATEAFEELRAEARKDFVFMFPLQARIRDRVAKHIFEGAFREQAMLKHWKESQVYIELPANVIKSISTIPGGWYAH
jgi:hypothetical protein